MAWRIRTDNFEGPFDLLLHLVQRQKVDIGTLSISAITDQYLDSIQALDYLDLEVASDFLVVASSLLEIKAASLLPEVEAPPEEEPRPVSVEELRECLLERLVSYKAYKDAASELAARCERMAGQRARHCGPDRELLGCYPDYLEQVSLDDLAHLVVNLAQERSRVLLESEHIAARPLPVERYVRTLSERIARAQKVHFSQLVSPNAPAALVVVNFLALLELYKRNRVDLRQEQSFGDIMIEALPSLKPSREASLEPDNSADGDEDHA